MEIFKEIMVELIRNREIDLDVLKKEQREYIQDNPEEFQLSDTLLKISEQGEAPVRKLLVSRIEGGEPVVFSGILDAEGQRRSIRCSNVLIQIVK